MDLKNYTNDLILKDGIYFSNKKDSISYPEKGNQDCFQIEQNSFWFNHRNNCILNAINNYCPKSVFFDIGGGNGFVAKSLQEKGIETVLIEPGLQGCLNAKKRNLTNVVCATLENANFNKNSIEAIGVFDVVEHIENDVAFLKSIHSFLKVNGFIFLTVPAYQFLWSNEDIDAGHFRRYTTKSIEKKLTEVGFEIVQATYIFSVLTLAVFLFRTIPSKLGFNKNSNNVKKHINEHKKKIGIFDTILNKIWQFELNQIKNNKTISIGSSCFIIAKKSL